TLPINTDPLGPPLGKTGIIPVFTHPGRVGDFWVGALRTDTPERIVPFDLLTAEDGVAPHGPHHFYAPIALLNQIGALVLNFHDCRPRMRGVTDAGCTTFTVGDGLHARGDFTKIQDAIDALPASGGLISILPGLYRQEFSIASRQNITIEGCGESTIIETPAG